MSSKHWIEKAIKKPGSFKARPNGRREHSGIRQRTRGGHR